MAKRETILVTGAGGAVGSQLVVELLAAGYKVRATDLPGKPFPFGGSRVKAVRGDLRDPKFVAELPYGADHIIHAGAALDIGLPWSVLKAVNLDATELLWERAVELGVGKFVFFSSASTYRGQDRPITEEDPQDPPGNYEKSKFLAEKMLMRSKLGGAKTHLVILRPALIIGPLGTALMATIACAPPILKEYLGFAPKLYGGSMTTVVHSLDVARAALFLMEKGLDGEVYNVGNEDALPFGDFYNIACQEYGLPVLPLPPIPMPSRRVVSHLMPFLTRPELFKIINTVGGGIWKHLQKKHNLTGPLSPKADKEAMSYMLSDYVFDVSKLMTTGFECRFPDYRSAIRDVLEWYKRERWIP